MEIRYLLVSERREQDTFGVMNANLQYIEVHVSPLSVACYFHYSSSVLERQKAK